MTSLPTLTQDDRKLAYQRSLELRQARADLKRWISEPVPADSCDSNASRFRAAFYFRAGEGMRVYTLLTALPYVGQRKALKLLEQAGIDPKRTVRACGPRQRERLFRILAERNSGPRDS